MATSAVMERARRAKVSVSVDARLLAKVDKFVADNPGTDRSKVFDRALWLWCREELDAALAAQFAQPDGVPPEERAAWNAIVDANTEDLLRGWAERERALGE